MYWTDNVDGGPRRVNHAAVAIGNKIYSFGGYCSGEVYDGTRPIDIYVLDTGTYRWQRVKVNYDRAAEEEGPAALLRTAPYQRYGHTVVEYGGKAYLWGGRNDDFGACYRMHVFDPQTRSWSVVECEGKPPPARDGHSAVVSGDVMYIFGGYEESSRRYSCETYAFNFVQSKWYQIRATGAIPQWRDFHTSCILDDCMYVFGGRSDQMLEFNAANDIYCDKLKVLNLKTNVWSEPEITGERPCGRRSHTAWVYNDRIYIFGGYLGTENLHFGDLWEFEPRACRWRQINPIGVAPAPRRRHCTVPIDDRVFLFGGTMPIDAKKPDPSLTGLSELADLHILDYAPTLRTLSSMTVLQHKLNDTYGYLLPVELRHELKMKTLPNEIVTMRQDG